MFIGLRKLTSIALALLLSASSGFAQSSHCGLPESVFHLAKALNGSVHATPQDRVAWRARLRGSIEKLDMDAVQQTLSSVGLRESRSIVGTLLIQAHRASSLGYEIDPKSVDQNVTNVIQLDQLVCKLSQTSPDPLPISSQSKIGQVTANLKLPRLIHSDTTTARMMLLLGSVSLTILTIYGLTLVYNWIYAYTHNRRLCRIQAVISQGLDVIDGHITLLDHKECHFQPVNDGALARVATLSNTSGVAL